MKKFIKNGEHWIWLNAAAVAISLIMVLGLLGLIGYKGLTHFWPKQLETVSIQLNNISQKQYLGELVDESAATDEHGTLSDTERQYLYKIGNRDSFGLDFVWLKQSQIISIKKPLLAVTMERREWGNLYGFIDSIQQAGIEVKPQPNQTNEQLLNLKLIRSNELIEKIKALEKSDIGRINYELEQLRLEQRKYQLKGTLSAKRIAEFQIKKVQYQSEFELIQKKLSELREQVNRDSVKMKLIDDSYVEVPLAKIVRWYQTNDLSVFGKTKIFLSRIWEFLSEDPREANTEGGVFPAIFGTVLMVLLMSAMVTPLGVIAAVYLKEYADQGFITRTVRIAVNNLAGVPSIVYGVFGLGFFVYFLGGSIDELFYPESSPSPVFGTPGLLWASLTLALLTLPVVIVSTEEGLSRVPKSIREGSLALGATKAETLWKTIIPMASPSIMTGMILAIARAAGEVAPLMLVGVVKLAPSLPLDGNAPFLHLDRKFMHLGFHIYDVGFQSPNVEAARPLVYATSLLLVMVIILLNLFAIRVRNKLRERYKALEN
jgi:phosphate transport system permease protein